MVLIALAAASGYAIFSSQSSSSQRSTQLLSTPVTDTGGVRHIVPLDKIISGGVPKDGIPSIDHPKFVSVSSANSFVSDSDIVFGLEYAGEARAYPALILVWHEIVNDVVNGQPVLITYCPLCYASIAFERTIDGEAVEFGVSGMLYNSDLVMYDRKTESYWSQILGKAIVGPLAGRDLKRIPIDFTTWGVWKKAHQDTTVLSRDTGYVRSYGVDPYDGYYTSDQIWFPIDHLDQRLHPKALVYGVMVDGAQEAYARDRLTQIELINDQVGGTDVVVWSIQNSSIRVFESRIGVVTLEFVLENGRIYDTQTHSEWNVEGVAISGPYAGTKLTRIVGVTCFWFAWATFYPDTGLYS